MARYWINGGIDSLWGSTSNWSDTSGGTGGFSVPTTTDDVFFDANSPNCTTNGSRSILSLNCTGYTNTLTFSSNNNMTLNGGNLTLSSGMTLVFNGTAGFVASITGGTFTANGQSVNRLTLNGSGVTHTLADTWTVTGLATLGASGTTTINGGSIVITGSLTVSGTTSVVTGTTTVSLTGTGTWTGPTSSGTLRLPLTINTAGTITLGTRVGIGGPFTYTAGTVVVTGSTFDVTGANATLNCSALTFNNVNFAGTASHTLSDDVYLTGLLTLGLTTNATVIDGGTIHAINGVRFGGTSGSVTGTTTVSVSGSQTLDGPSRVTGGRIELPFLLDAPTGTITVSNGFYIRLSHLDITTGTTVTTAAGSWTVGG